MFRNFYNSIMGRYYSHPEAVVITCFFNPQNSPYRTKAFQQFYSSIEHLNHRIIECVIGDAKPQLPYSPNITRVNTPHLLWHKEALLNKIVSELPKKFKYVFWVDADVIFTNHRWLTEGVEQLQNNNVIQPFEYCIHLEKDETFPSFDTELAKEHINDVVPTSQRRIWRSFSANYVDTSLASNENYDKHGHVGFAWGARREVLDKVPLYDKALVGGADHIIAHAAAGHIPHRCIDKSFTDDLDDVYAWSKKFFNVTFGEIGYVKGDW